MTAAVALDYLRKFVRERSAIVLPEEKNYLLESRLGPVANDAGVDGLGGIVQQLRTGRVPELETQVVEALTTNETYFFRDQHPFETLRTAVLPRLLEARKNRRELRIWCAAASSGQEPYTVAMLLRGLLPNVAEWSIELIATDINQTVLDKAKAGIYRQHEVNRGLPAPMLVKYFARDGADWQVHESVREMVDYRKMNLLDHWPLRGVFDLVLLRNVLIYFDVEVKREILDRTRRLMTKDAALFLGGAETTVRLHEGYQPTREGRTTYYTVR